MQQTTWGAILLPKGFYLRFVEQFDGTSVQVWRDGDLLLDVGAHDTERLRILLQLAKEGRA